MKAVRKSFVQIFALSVISYCCGVNSQGIYQALFNIFISTYSNAELLVAACICYNAFCS